ncbi:MAG: hypothetical protein DRI65_07560 [Chloroflexota bacterium]|nr:MAG: hypothetical protein DRI65_07560 [Chloroflexota bacterium]
MNKFNFMYSAVIALIVLASTSAAGAEPTFGEYTVKGFLSGYSKLAPEGGESKAYLYRDLSVDMKKYNKIQIDRIKIWFKDDAEYKGIDPTELKDIADYFHKAITGALSDKYEIVNEAGPDVLRLRVAITDLVPNKPSASVVTLFVPFLWAGEAGAGAAEGEVGSTPFVGEATIEIEAMDSQSSKQIAAYIETRVGKKYVWNKGVGEGVGQYAKAYSTWAYTQKAMDYWAKLLRERLDAARAQ